MDLHPLFAPFEYVDHAMSGLLHGAPLPIVLALAVLLGLRHASDPDHLMAVTSLVAADDAGTRAAARLGAIWGLGHAAVLVLVGVPLIMLRSSLPPWLENAAEKTVGLVIAALAVRVLVRWLRGANPRHSHRKLRTPRQAFAIGALHGLAGTGGVVLLLLAAVPSPLAAAAALAAFAPMTAASMALCTTGFAWTLTRPAVLPVYHSVLLPAIGAAGLVFGVAYAGLL
jgi:hypothetical protein